MKVRYEPPREGVEDGRLVFATVLELDYVLGSIEWWNKPQSYGSEHDAHKRHVRTKCARCGRHSRQSMANYGSKAHPYGGWAQTKKPCKGCGGTEQVCIACEVFAGYQLQADTLIEQLAKEQVEFSAIWGEEAEVCGSFESIRNPKGGWNQPCVNCSWLPRFHGVEPVRPADRRHVPGDEWEYMEAV